MGTLISCASQADAKQSTAPYVWMGRRGPSHRLAKLVFVESFVSFWAFKILKTPPNPVRCRESDAGLNHVQENSNSNTQNHQGQKNRFRYAELWQQSIIFLMVLKFNLLKPAKTLNCLGVSKKNQYSLVRRYFALRSCID